MCLGAFPWRWSPIHLGSTPAPTYLPPEEWSLFIGTDKRKLIVASSRPGGGGFTFLAHDEHTAKLKVFITACNLQFDNILCHVDITESVHDGVV